MKFDIEKTKWLVPALALLIILESVIIVNRLEKDRLVQQEAVSRPETIVAETQPAIISIQGQEQLLLGEEGSLSVVLTALENLNLDGVDLYLKYDPSKVEVISVEPTDRFSFIGRNWVEPEKERILISLIESDLSTTVDFDSGSQTVLAEVKFKPITSGQAKFEIYNPLEAPGTVLAGQGSEIGFTKNDFTLNID